MSNRALINQNHSLIYSLWNKRDQPEVRERIIALYKEIEREAENEREAFGARENIEILQREYAVTSQCENNSKHHDTASEQMYTIQDFEDVREFLLIEKPDVDFSHIGGLSDVKETLRMECVYPRMHRKLYDQYGRTPGTGILLWGPPGTGKTKLAKAVAKESDPDAPFIKIDASILSKWVGAQEKRFKAIFRYARESEKGATIFLDDLECLFPRSGPNYIQRVRSIMLTEMSGINSNNENLLVLSASNKPWLIDPGMRRAGRFTKIIFVPPPDEEARKEIFKIHLRKLLSKGMLSNDVSLEELVSLTHRFSGADIEAICIEAIDLPLKEAIKGAQPRQVNRDDFLKAISHREPSIIPWLIDAQEAVKRYKENELASHIEELIKKFLSPQTLE